VLIAVLNVQFHLFQEAINQFTAVIVLENTNQMIQVMIDHLVTTEVQDIQEMTEVEEMTDIQEMVEIENKQL
jgi:hypothetical protein